MPCGTGILLSIPPHAWPPLKGLLHSPDSPLTWKLPRWCVKLSQLTSFSSRKWVDNIPSQIEKQRKDLQFMQFVCDGARELTILLAGNHNLNRISTSKNSFPTCSGSHRAAFRLLTRGWRIGGWTVKMTRERIKWQTCWVLLNAGWIYIAWLKRHTFFFFLHAKDAMWAA